MRKINLLVLLFTIIFSNSSIIYAQNKAIFLGDSTVWADSILEGLSINRK